MREFRVRQRRWWRGLNLIMSGTRRKLLILTLRRVRDLPVGFWFSFLFLSGWFIVMEKLFALRSAAPLALDVI